MAISNTILATTLGNVYVSSGSSAVTAIYLCNIDGSAQNFNLYAVPSGGSADNTTQIYANVSIVSEDTYVIDTEKLIMEDGDYLVGNCTANSAITVTVSSIGI